MQLFRAFFLCVVMALIFQAGSSHAGEEASLIGRWQVDDKPSSPSPTDNFTMDIVSCGKQLCGIRVDKGRCGGVVFKPYVPARSGQGNSVMDPPTYLYIRPDLNEEFIVDTPHIAGVNSFRLFGETMRSVGKGGGLFDLISRNPIQRRTYPADHIFKRIGPAECEPPATS